MSKTSKTLRGLLLTKFEGVRRIGKSIYHIRRIEGEVIMKVVEAASYLSRIDYQRIRRPKLNTVRERL